MNPIEIQSPVKGEWSFMNPPGHHPDAKDFVAVNAKGAPYPLICVVYHLFYKLSVTDTFAWGKEVFSPFEGIVRATEDDQNDRVSLNLFRDLFTGLVIAPRNTNKGIEFFVGNHVIIESTEEISVETSTKTFALLAHLKKASVVVNEGQHVQMGQVVAQVGNSGNSIQPHLHFQLMKENDPAKAWPVPFLLKSYLINKNGEWRSAKSALPRNYQHFKV